MYGAAYVGYNNTLIFTGMEPCTSLTMEVLETDILNGDDTNGGRVMGLKSILPLFCL